jgi:hypothetical protein
MRAWHTFVLLGIAATLMGVSSHAVAQQMTIHTPFRTASDSFFEQTGISWSGNYRGITFSYGGGALAVPPFGGAQPGAGLSANFAFVGKDGQINFATNFGSGYRQSFTTQTPSVTIMNGQTGSISDTSQTPFVISVIPVVGAFPVAPPMLPPMLPPPDDPLGIDPRVQAMMQARTDAQDQAAAQAAAQAQAGGPVQPLPAPPRPNNMAPRINKPADPVPAGPDPGDAAAERLNAAQQSTAGRPAPSVAEAKRMHQQEQAAADEELSALMVRAEALEEDGKPSVAKIYYQRIAKHASGALQQQAKQKLYELEGKR